MTPFRAFALLVGFFFFAFKASAGQTALTETIVMTLPASAGAGLPDSPAAVLAAAQHRDQTTVRLSNSLALKLLWTTGPDYCAKLNGADEEMLGRWAELMKQASEATYPPEAKWQGSVTTKKLGPNGTVAIYRFTQSEDPAEMSHHVIILDGFGKEVLGAVTLKWTGPSGDQDEQAVEKIIASIRPAK